MKRQKQPNNLPDLGDTCILRENGEIGVLKSIDAINLWCKVEWQHPDRVDQYCYLYDLEKANK